MYTALGFTRFNIHKISKTLDANKQVTPTSNLEYVCSVIDNNKVLACTIVDNVATITESGYSEGDTVDIILCCLRPSEGGNICEQIIVQADEDTWNDYLVAVSTS